MVTKSPLDSDVDHFPETFEAKFRADTATIPPVRLELQNWLSAAGLESVVGDVVLVCDELMANAAVHGCRGLPPDTELAVTVKWCAGRLRVIVSDPSSEKPREQGDSDSRPSGRGLKLVGAFSECWGVDEAPDRHGKSVWANVHAQTPSSSRKYCPTNSPACRNCRKWTATSPSGPSLPSAPPHQPDPAEAPARTPMFIGAMDDH